MLHFTIKVPKSHPQPQCTSQLVCKDRLLYVSVDLHLSFCCHQHPKCERAIRLLYPLLFFLLKKELRSSSCLTNKKSDGVCSGDSKRCISPTTQNHISVRTNLFIPLTLTDAITSQNIDLSS